MFFYGVPIIILCERLGEKLNFDIIFYVHMYSLDMHIISYLLYIWYDISKWFAKYNNSVNHVLECDYLAQYLTNNTTNNS